MRLAEFKALTFDCYGTLIDWETGMIAALKPLTDRVALALGRDAILEAHAGRSRGSNATHRNALQRSPRGGLQAPGRGIESRSMQRNVIPTGDPSGTGRHFPTPQRRSDISSNTTADHPVERRQRVFRVQPCAARRCVRRRLHGRGHWLLQAVGTQLRVHAGPSGGTRPHEDRRASYRREPLPRPCSRQGAALSTCWVYRRHGQDGFGATMDPGRQPSPDFRFELDGRTGGGTPARDPRRA